MEETPKLRFKLVDKKTGIERTSGKCWQQLNAQITKLEEHKDNLYSRIISLERHINELEKPSRLKRVLELLNKEEKPRTLLWIQNRVSINYYDFRELVNSKTLDVFRKGNRTMYYYKEVKK